MATSTSERVQKHRDALRAAGLRPVQIWVPDTRPPALPKNAAGNRWPYKAMRTNRKHWNGLKLPATARAGSEAW